MDLGGDLAILHPVPVHHAADDRPADHRPADDGPADDRPADHRPADDGPADDGPADDGPATTAPPTTAPPTTAPPTTAPPTTPPPTGEPGSCAATYRAVNSWPGGFQGEVTVANNTATTISGWTVRLTLGSGQAISSLWGGTNTGATGDVTVRNAAYNGTLGANASTTFGFTATGNGDTPPGNLTCTSP
ncbi:Cellulose-binding family II (fragment) [Micromonospora lupini str. Lupac 08]|uniref:Cellulose-binding family II n=1 Tax=Micromonospora lupini str. Lupac 08 TaxID=1150864 RepID=I0KZP7_9ACTN